MTLAILVLICVALMVLGASAGKPLGWVAIGLALLALLIAVLGTPNPFR